MVSTVEQLAALVGGRLMGDGRVPIQSARPLTEAGPGDITFVSDERYAKLLRTSPASAALVGPHFQCPAPKKPLALIEVADPMSAFVKVRAHLTAARRPRWVGVHPQAFVAPSAKLGTEVAVYPFAYVGEHAELGDHCTVYPGAIVGDRCRLGRQVVLHPNVVLYEGVVLGNRVEIHAGAVLGGDGFRYLQAEGKHVKVPHTGNVEVGDDVEIGANCAIDRGVFEATRIGEGTKIDNLVMIGHNNVIGRHNILCGQVGLAGSCKTGDYVVLAGQVGIKDHTELGDQAVVGAQAGVHRNVASGQHVLGSPAIPIRDQRRIFQMTARLPEMYARLRTLADEVAQLRQQVAGNAGAAGAEPQELPGSD